MVETLDYPHHPESTNKGNCKFTTYLNVITLYTVSYVSMCPDLSLLAQPCQSCGNTRVKYNICHKKKLGWSYLHEIGSVSYPVFPPSLGSTNFYWFLYKKESRLCLKLLYYLPVYCLKVLHRDGTKWGRFHPYNLWSPRIVWSGIVTNNTYTINIVSLLPSKFIETLVITNIGCVLKYFPPSVLRLSESAHFTDLR